MASISDQFRSRAYGVTDVPPVCPPISIGDFGFWVCHPSGTVFLPVTGDIHSLAETRSRAVTVDVFCPGAHWYKWTVTGPGDHGVVAPCTPREALSVIDAAWFVAPRAEPLPRAA